MTDNQLKLLDPARTPADLDVAADHAAQAILDRVRSGERVVPIHRPRRTRRLVLAAGSIAAAGAIVVAAPSFLGGPQSAAAWTPVPQTVPAGEALSMARDCVGREPHFPSKDMRVYVAEERGRWELLYLADANADNELICLLENGRPTGAIGASMVRLGGYEQVAPDGARGNEGGLFQDHGKSNLVSTGVVGEDVTGLVLHGTSKGDVTATVSDGHYAAWWPSDEPLPLDDKSIPNAFTDATITLRDGSTREMTFQQLTSRPADAVVSGGSAD